MLPAYRSINLDLLSERFNDLDPLDFYESCLIFPQDEDLATLMDVLQVDPCRIKERYNGWESFHQMEEMHRSHIEKHDCWGFVPTRQISTPLPFEGTVVTYVISPESHKHFLLCGGSHCTKSKKINLYVFDIDTSKWYFVHSNGDSPCIRYGYCFINMSHTEPFLWVFGGRIDPYKLCSDDVFTYSMRTLTWKKVLLHQNAPRPKPRVDACCVFVNKLGINGTIILCGGCDLNDNYFDDIWLWDVETNSWNRPILIGKNPMNNCRCICMLEATGDRLLFWDRNKKNALAEKSHDCANLSFRLIENEYDYPCTALDIKSEVWTFYRLWQRSCSHSFSNSYMMASFVENMYTFLVTLPINGSIKVSMISKWRWNAFNETEITSNMLKIMMERRKFVCDLIKKLIKARTLTKCSKLRHVYEECEMNLRWLIDTSFTKLSEQTCHMTINVGGSILVIRRHRHDNYANIHLVLRLDLPSKKARFDEIIKLEEFESECKSIHKNVIAQRNKRKRFEKLKKEEEDEIEILEQERMKIEDDLSHLPPLSVAPSVELKFATRSTLWLKWPKVLKNSSGQFIDGGEVEYILQAKGRYIDIEKGNKVKMNSVGQPNTLLSGVVIRKGSNGCVDICFENGTIKTNVIREHLTWESADWEIIFSEKKRMNMVFKLFLYMYSKKKEI